MKGLRNLVKATKAVLLPAIGDRPAFVTIDPVPVEGKRIHTVVVTPNPGTTFGNVDAMNVAVYFSELEDDFSYVHDIYANHVHIVFEVKFRGQKVRVFLCYMPHPVAPTETSIPFHYVDKELVQCAKQDDESAYVGEQAAVEDIVDFNKFSDETVQELASNEPERFAIAVYLLLVCNGGNATIQEVSSLTRQQQCKAFFFLRDKYQSRFLNVEKTPGETPSFLRKFIS